LTIPPAAASSLVHGRIVRLSDVHLDMASDAGTVNILRGITLDIAAGETAAVVGPSGAGKSSLMMVAGGLERATAGRVEVAGRDLGPLGDDDRARLRRDNIGIVFQGFHLIPTMTAHENVALPLEFAGRGDAFELAGTALEVSAIASATIRRSSRAASSSASPWRAPSSRGPSSCWPTSRPAISTARPASK
jgi:putative ABC transport system ATP-binding protein